ncbi:glycine betaine ABC transporter substrate-binding protein [Alicyclobacillus cycloheptanicus]|uniref:Glycine betaine/proline transport system substrate-binding protein n=2 Tax=Alicyclobacillus cycloheptanicus TaxID=1457 RepID=A0ABT9XM96_9BACL|nr:glycine betaine ABC transporter substrate-binding protein [Alicyclobacillus cycloheptanicus]MDQ0191149.1 glycine betaine/proline transport system substrate-binding protein [Alicyclobacillus cycloheptanicus]WDM01890.1 glycine betaine ABC transporter substrate-binding protein [Alicyclobacillus cycloheptanicus]
MSNTKKTLIGLTSAVVVAALVAGCGTTGNSTSNGTGNQAGTQSTSGSKDITLGMINWSEDVAVTYLWQDILKSKGYNVTIKEFSDPGPMYTGLADNSLNVYLDTWLPITHQQYIDKFGSDYVDLGKWYQGSTTEGFVVPDYVYKQGIHTISDLESHASLFGGQIVGIEAGAGETGLAQKAIQEYGLTNMKLVTSSTAAMLSQLKTDYAQKKPVVVTLWSPHWAFTAYKLDYLSDPKHAFGQAGWIQTEANKQWASSNPTVAGWLKNFKMTPDQLGTLEQDINKDSANPDQGVQEWMQANQSLINSWLK